MFGSIVTQSQDLWIHGSLLVHLHKPLMHIKKKFQILRCQYYDYYGEYSYSHKYEVFCYGQPPVLTSTLLPSNQVL